MRSGLSPSVVGRKLLAGKSADEIRADAEAYFAEQADRESADEDGTDNETYRAARSRKESAIANLRELEVAEKEGRLLERAQVEADAFKAARTVRDALISIPDRVASLLAAETDPTRIHATLSEEIRKALAAPADTRGVRCRSLTRHSATACAQIHYSPSASGRMPTAS